MHKDDFNRLDVGDIIRTRWDGHSYVVVYCIERGHYAVSRVLTATNPMEWELSEITRHRLAEVAKEEQS